MNMKAYFLKWNHFNERIRTRLRFVVVDMYSKTLENASSIVVYVTGSFKRKCHDYGNKKYKVNAVRRQKNSTGITWFRIKLIYCKCFKLQEFRRGVYVFGCFEAAQFKHCNVFYFTYTLIGLSPYFLGSGHLTFLLAALWRVATPCRRLRHNVHDVQSFSGC